MLTIGLTGGIASGKSTVARRAASHGAVVIDADALAREVVEPGTPGLAAVSDAFGAGVLTADGSLHRPALGAVVFADPAARTRLNEIVHPLVARRTAELLAELPDDAVVVHDVPLLAENGLAPGYHLVIVVEAPVDLRVERLARARGMTPAEVRARIASQASDDERRAVADVVLANDATVGALEERVDVLWADRVQPYADNILNRRRQTGADGVELVPYDPTWPAQFERLSRRLQHVVGGLWIDHIGSTAVPGLAAKDVIDMQVTVDSLERAQGLEPALQKAGFPAVPGVHGDRPKDVDPDPAHWAKRLHGSADPGRAANIHLRVAGSPGWRYALLFRDWLRSVPAEAAAYEAGKRRLAAHRARSDYAEAKEPWFDRALPRAEQWARGTGWRA